MSAMKTLDGPLNSAGARAICVSQSSAVASSSPPEGTGPFTKKAGLVVVVTSMISNLLFSAADNSRLLLGSISAFSEISPEADANGGSNDGDAVLRFFRNWNPGVPPILSPITAWSLIASITIPQLVHAPPENPMNPDPLLVRVLTRLAP